MNFFLKLTINLLVISSSLFAQGVISSVSNLDYIFGSGDIVNCKVDRNILYVLSSKLICDEDCSPSADQNVSVGIYDLSNPASPIEVGRRFRLTYQGNLSFKNNVSYITNSSLSSPFYCITPGNRSTNPMYFWPSTVIQLDSIIYEFRQYSQEVKIHKIVSNGKIQYLKTILLQKNVEDINGLGVVKNIVYVTSNSGLTILDATNLEIPIELNSPIKDTQLKGLIVGNGKILIGHNFSEIILLDVTNPRVPLVRTRLSFSFNQFTGIYANNHYFLLGTERIEILNAELMKENSILPAGSVGNLVLDNNKFIAATNIGVEIYDVSNISRINRIGMFGANVSSPADFEKKDNSLFTVNKGDGLTVINVADKKAPKKVGELDFEGFSLEIEVDKNYAYIADYIKGLVIVDVSNPALPSILSQLPEVGAAVSLALLDNKIFILNDNDELYVVDVSEKFTPKIELRKEITESHKKRWGHYKKIAAVKNQLWLSIYGSSLKAFTYNTQSGYKEIYNDNSWPTMATEFMIADSLLFITDPGGIKIMNTNTLALLNNSKFGTSHMEEITICTAYSINNKILYLSMSVYAASSYIKHYDLSDIKNPKRVMSSSTFGWPPAKMKYDQSHLYTLTPNGIRIYSADETVDIAEVYNKKIPADFCLQQNFPNPFNPETTINYQISEASHVTIKVYDMLGKEIALLVDEFKQPGFYNCEFRMENGELTSGIYFYRIQAGNFNQTKKFAFMK